MCIVLVVFSDAFREILGSADSGFIDFKFAGFRHAIISFHNVLRLCAINAVELPLDGRTVIGLQNFILRSPVFASRTIPSGMDPGISASYGTPSVYPLIRFSRLFYVRTACLIAESRNRAAQ